MADRARAHLGAGGFGDGQAGPELEAIGGRSQKLLKKRYIGLTRFVNDRYTARAGWSSLVARRAHNPEVEGSNPSPATKDTSIIWLATSEMALHRVNTVCIALAPIPRKLGQVSRLRFQKHGVPVGAGTGN